MFTVAVLGASGAVGQEMIKTLERRNFPVKELRLLASPRSAGRKIVFRGQLRTVEVVSEEKFDGVDFALFSAGGSVSKKWAPIAAARGAYVIDNTSAFRMDKDVPLVVPEVNPEALDSIPRKIIANPNCSTIQMVVALKPLHDEAKIRRVVVATYQSTSGKGTLAMEQLTEESEELLHGEQGPLIPDTVQGQPAPFPHQIAFNCLPHIDSFTDNGYTKEEMKMVNETRKILSDPSILLSATTVRVPVYRSHSEAVNVEFRKKISAERARELLRNAPGVVVVDNPANNDYPLAIYAENQDPVYVGRIREDISCPTGIDMWVVADNLLKGAALNAIQIAEVMAEKGIVTPGIGKPAKSTKPTKVAKKPVAVGKGGK